jgi:hypothetical protein
VVRDGHDDLLAVIERDHDRVWKSSETIGSHLERGWITNQERTASGKACGAIDAGADLVEERGGDPRVALEVPVEGGLDLRLGCTVNPHG